MSVPILGQNSRAIDGPVFRLLFCLVCRTLEELPPFEGRVENDVLLNIAVEKHQFPSGEPHKGKLFILPVQTWLDKEQREEIIRQIKGGGSEGLNQIDETFYDTKSTFSEDALVCFSKHLRPQNGCPDYESSSKRLLPTSTKQERKEAGLPDVTEGPGPRVYLCHFCPVHSTVMNKKNLLRGI